MTHKDDIVKKDNGNSGAGGPKRAAGPKVSGGSRQARRTGAVILDVLAGVCTPTDAAGILEVTVPRYYALESRALEGMVEACEARPKGRQMSAESELMKLREEVNRLTRECSRRQSLLRAVQRTMAIPDVSARSKKPKDSNGKRKRRPTVRALKASRRLRMESPPLESTEPSGNGEETAPMKGAGAI